MVRIISKAHGYDVTSTQIITDGYEILGGYAQGRNSFVEDSRSQTVTIGSDFAGTTADELVIAVEAQTSSNNLMGSIQWMEL